MRVSLELGVSYAGERLVVRMSVTVNPETGEVSVFPGTEQPVVTLNVDDILSEKWIDRRSVVRYRSSESSQSVDVSTITRCDRNDDEQVTICWFVSEHETPKHLLPCGLRINKVDGEWRPHLHLWQED